MTVREKDRKPIVIEVPPEFAAEFLTEQLQMQPIKRPVFPLRLGDVDLGSWQVMSVATEPVPYAGYSVTFAVLRPVWE